MDKEPAQLDELKSLRAELAAAKAKRADRDAARSQEVEKTRLQEQIKLEQIADEKGLSVEADILTVFSSHSGRMIAVKAPIQAFFNGFARKQSKDKVEISDYWDLVKHCLVYPTPPELDDIFQEAPGLLIRAANACIKLANAVEQELGKE